MVEMYNYDKDKVDMMVADIKGYLNNEMTSRTR